MIADRTEIRRMPPATVAAHAFIWASQWDLSQATRAIAGAANAGFNAIVLPTLTRAGYTGPVGFEAFSPQVLSPPLAAGQAVWRALWSEPDVIAADARTLIDEHLVAASCEENGSGR